jgi:hypothetical protein
MFRGRDYFILTAAFISFLFSVYLWFGGQRDAGMFVGIWVPSILAFGAFAKAGGSRCHVVGLDHLHHRALRLGALRRVHRGVCGGAP